jgi:hypothetical protein
MTDDLRTQLESKTDDELIEMLRDRVSGEWRPEALLAAATSPNSSSWSLSRGS